jgi:hypothetical protein
MNSTYFGRAATDPRAWLNPTGSVNDTRNSQIPVVEGALICSIPNNQKKYCFHEMNRSIVRGEAPYDVKKPKKKKATIFTDQEIIDHGPRTQLKHHKPVTLYKKRNFRNRDAPIQL